MAGFDSLVLKGFCNCSCLLFWYVICLNWKCIFNFLIVPMIHLCHHAFLKIGLLNSKTIIFLQNNFFCDLSRNHFFQQYACQNIQIFLATMFLNNKGTVQPLSNGRPRISSSVGPPTYYLTILSQKLQKKEINCILRRVWEAWGV